MEKIIASVFWEECRDYLAPLISKVFQASIGEIAGTVSAKNGAGFFSPFFVGQFMNAADFGVIDTAFCLNKLASFPRAFLALSKEEINDLATYLKEHDKTWQIIDLEDKCLYVSEKSEALETVLRYLRVLKSGEKIPLWAYLDHEKKAVACFVYDRGWQVRLFCKSEKECEALHWVEHLGFVPVVFTKDISEYLENVRLAGGFCLKEYLPREFGDLLSKKKMNRPENFSEKQLQRRHDRGDFL